MDGEIIIKTAIDTSGFKKGQKEIEDLTKNMSKVDVSDSVSDGIGVTAEELETLLDNMSTRMEEFTLEFAQGFADGFAEAFGDTGEIDTHKEKLKEDKEQVEENEKAQKKATKTTNGFADSFKKGLKSLAKFALGIVGIGSAIALFKKLTGVFKQGFIELAQYDQQTNQTVSELKSSLAQLKGAFILAFEPLANYVLPIVSKAIQWFSGLVDKVGQFVAALTGRNTVKRATYQYQDYADSLHDTAEAAKEVKSYLTGLDEVQKASSGGGAGGVGGNAGGGLGYGIEEAPIDPKIFEFAEKLKEKFNDFIEKIDWDKLKQNFDTFIGSFKDLTDGVGEFLDVINTGGVFAWFIDTAIPTILRFISETNTGTGDTFGGLADSIQAFKDKDPEGVIDGTMRAYDGFTRVLEAPITAVFPGFHDKMQEIRESIAGVYTTVGEGGGKFGSGFKQMFDGVKNNDPSEIINGMQRNFEGLLLVVSAPLTAVFPGLKEHVGETAQFFGQKVNEMIGYVVQFVNSVPQHIENMANKIRVLIELIVALTIKGAANMLTNVITTYNNMSANISATLSNISQKIGSTWENIKTNARTMWNSIVSTIKSIIGVLPQWMQDKFYDAWNRVKGVFSKGGSVFSGLTEGIEQYFKTVVNSLITGINSAISRPFNKINSALNTIRNVGIGDLKPFSSIPSISVPSIPYLATGAVIPPNKMFMAMLGDQRNGNNLEAPESLIRQIVREESGHGAVVVQATANRRVLFEMMIDEGKRQMSQTGRNPFEFA